MILTVRAYTRVGGGTPATHSVSTLSKPRELFAKERYIYVILYYSHPHAAAVKGVTVTQLNDTSVNVSWKALIIHDFPIESYTVVYSPVSDSDGRQDGEMTAVFPGSVTSGVITDLEPAVIYQFQVFATVTANDVSVEGEWSDPVFKTSKGRRTFHVALSKLSPSRPREGTRLHSMYIYTTFHLYIMLYLFP